MDDPMILERNHVLSCLRRVLDRRDDVVLAYIFGSLAEKGHSSHDVDVAVLLESDDPKIKLGNLADLVIDIAGELGVNEDRVNVINMRSASLPLKYNIIKHGVKVKGGESFERETISDLLMRYPDLITELKTWMNLDADPKVDISVVESRTADLRRNVRYLKAKVLSRPLDKIVSSYGNSLAMERATQRALEAMLDICRHLVSVHSLGLAESYADYPRKLAKRSLMPEDLAEDLARLTGVRNILVHRYLEVDYEAFYNTIKHLVNEVYPSFIKWVRSILSPQRSPP